MRTWPEVIDTEPHTTPISVVLPAPFGPRRAKISPLAISRSIAWRATRPDLYRLVTAAIDIIGGGPRARAGAANLRPRARYVGPWRPRVIPLAERLHRKARSGNAVGADQDLRNPRRESERHRHEEAIDAGLTVRAIVPVEDPIISILAGQRLGDGNAADVAVDRVIVVRDPVHLLGTKMVRVRRPAARSFHPVGNSFSGRPVVVRVRAASGQSKQQHSDSSDHLSPLCGF